MCVYLLQKLVQRLNAMKLSTSSMTSLKKLDSYGLKFDDKLKELQELQAKVISNPEEFKLEHNDGTFKICLRSPLPTFAGIFSPSPS